MTISVRLPRQVETELRAHLEAEGIGLSEFVRQAIIDKMQNNRTGSKLSAYELGKDVFGKHGSGQSDRSVTRKQGLREAVSAKYRRRDPDSSV